MHLEKWHLSKIEKNKFMVWKFGDQTDQRMQYNYFTNEYEANRFLQQMETGIFFDDNE